MGEAEGSKGRGSFNMRRLVGYQEKIDDLHLQRRELAREGMRRLVKATILDRGGWKESLEKVVDLKWAA